MRIRRIEAEKETWNNNLVADDTKNKLQLVGTLKYINVFTTRRYTSSTCQLYYRQIVHKYKCLSSFLFFRLSSTWERERERERVYNWVLGETVSKFTYLISMDSCGEYFLFYGLTDFRLFLVLAWRYGSSLSKIPFVFLYPESWL